MITWLCPEISWSREITQHCLDLRNRLVLLSAITATQCGLLFLSLTLQSFPVFLCDRFVTYADRNKEYHYFKQFCFSCSHQTASLNMRHLFSLPHTPPPPPCNDPGGHGLLCWAQSPAAAKPAGGTARLSYRWFSTIYPLCILLTLVCGLHVCALSYLEQLSSLGSGLQSCCYFIWYK